MKAPSDIVLRRVLVGHRAAVNVVDFDDKYIVSASGDRTIKVCSIAWMIWVLVYHLHAHTHARTHTTRTHIHAHTES